MICPATLRNNWADEAHRWLGLTDAQMHIVWAGKDMATAIQAGKQYIVVSYELISNAKVKAACEKHFKVCSASMQSYVPEGAELQASSAAPCDCMLLVADCVALQRHLASANAIWATGQGPCAMTQAPGACDHAISAFRLQMHALTEHTFVHNA